MRWSGVRVVDVVPGQGHPGCIIVIVEFIQKFDQQACVLCLYVNNTQTVLVLWFAGCLPGYQTPLQSLFQHIEAVFPMTEGGSFKVHM